MSMRRGRSENIPGTIRPFKVIDLSDGHLLESYALTDNVVYLSDTRDEG